MKSIKALIAGIFTIGSGAAAAVDFQATNSLEEALVEAQAGKMGVQDFLDKLVISKVVMLLDKPVLESGQWNNSIRPLVLTSTSGTSMLALFTSPERATSMTQQSKQHEYAFLTDFAWAINGVSGDIGVVINPGWSTGLEIQPARLAELRQGAR